MPSHTSNLLDQLITGSIGPLSKLQESLNLTIDQITSWIGKAQTRAQIDNLQALFNAQAQLMTCQHRLFAVAKLAEVVATASAPETIRRACMNLLKIELVDFSKDTRAEQRGDRNPMQPPDELTQEMIRHALDEMGRKNFESYADPREPAEPEPPPHSPPRHDAEPAYQFSQKGTEIAAASAAAAAGGRGSADQQTRMKPGMKPECRDQSARAHYTLGAGIPHSGAMREGEPDSRNFRAVLYRRRMPTSQRGEPLARSRSASSSSVIAAVRARRQRGHHL